MKGNLFFCEYCEIEKYDSEIQMLVDVPFECATLAHWKQHLKTKKHSLNKAISDNLTDECKVECKHCSQSFSKKQYEKHKERNKLLWLMKTETNEYKDCSCNNFIYNGKRFNNIKVLKSYTENRYKSGRKKEIYVPKEKKVKSFAERGKAIKNYEKRKETQREEYKKKKEEDQNIKIEISNDEETDSETEVETDILSSNEETDYSDEDI